MNKVFLLGRLTKDVELKYAPTGTAVAHFTVATSKKYTKDGKTEEKTEFTKVKVFGKLGELCNQYLSKGRQCMVEGELQTRTWDDKDGKKCYMTEVLSFNVQFLGEKQKEETEDKSKYYTSEKQKELYVSKDADYSADDIPF